MEQQADYIRRIEIKGLWARFNIQWDLRPDVNILSGINGVGKTTILNRSVGYLEQLSGDIQLSGEMKSDAKNGVHLFFDNPAATYIPYDVIRSYDRPLIMGDFTARMADKNVKSELDWQLYLLQRRYLDYQVNIGNKMIEMLSSNDEEQRSKAATLSLAKRRFQDMIDELFSYTRKKIDRRRNDIAFYQDGELLFPYKLSSGEKQNARDSADSARAGQQPLCPFHGRTGSLPAHRMAAEAHRHDTQPESQCAAYPHHPFARRHHGRLAGCRHRSQRNLLPNP